MSKVQNLVQEIKTLSVVDVLSLVELLEKEFGVSASAMVAASTASVSGGDVKEVAEKNAFKIELVEVDATKKNAVIKAVRTLKKELGLIEAKKATESLPFVLFESANKEEVENAKKVLDEAGAKIKIS